MKEKISVFIKQSFVLTGKYFLGKTITSLVIAAICLLSFLLLDIKLLGLIIPIIFLTNFIPIIGPWSGTILCGLIVVFQAPLLALYAVLITLALQLIEQFILLPLFIGKAIDLKPLLIIIVIIISSIFLGFWGVLFAVPLAAIIKAGYQIFFTKDRPSNI